jgi:hypothetical protein
VGYGLAGFTTYDSRKWQPNFTRFKRKTIGGGGEEMKNTSVEPQRKPFS